LEKKFVLLLLPPVKVCKAIFSKLSGNAWRGKEVNEVPTEKEIKIIQQAVLYELRRLVKKSGKDYTNEELCDLLDTIAEAKDQE